MDFINSILYSITSSLILPPYCFILLIMIFIIYLKNRKITQVQKLMTGGSVDSAFEITLSQFVSGLAGGIAGSIVLNFLGITFSEDCRIELLFIISICLMAFKSRFICFSYSGAVLGAIGIVLELLQKIFKNSTVFNFRVDVYTIMMLVGIMHIIEGMLIFFNGHKGTFPVIKKIKGKAAGGYTMKSFWIIPLVIMIYGNDFEKYSYMHGVLLRDVPGFFYNIQPESFINFLKTVFIYLFCFFAAAGYNSVTFTRTKKEKAHAAGIFVFLYGIYAVLIAQSAIFGILGKLTAIIFIPLGHEFMLKLQLADEFLKTLKFVNINKGLKVLEVSSDCELKKYKVCPGCRIISINDERIFSENHMYSVFRKYGNQGKIKIAYPNEHEMEIDFKYTGKRIGLCLVPDYGEKKSETKTFLEILQEIEQQLNEKNNKK